MDIDVKGTIYEGLLQKNAEETKSGAGQRFYTQRDPQNQNRKVRRNRTRTN